MIKRMVARRRFPVLIFRGLVAVLLLWFVRMTVHMSADLAQTSSDLNLHQGSPAESSVRQEVKILADLSKIGSTITECQRDICKLSQVLYIEGVFHLVQNAAVSAEEYLASSKETLDILEAVKLPYKVLSQEELLANFARSEVLLKQGVHYLLPLANSPLSSFETTVQIVNIPRSITLLGIDWSATSDILTVWPFSTEIQSVHKDGDDDTWTFLETVWGRTLNDLRSTFGAYIMETVVVSRSLNSQLADDFVKAISAPQSHQPWVDALSHSMDWLSGISDMTAEQNLAILHQRGFRKQKNPMVDSSALQQALTTKTSYGWHIDEFDETDSVEAALNAMSNADVILGVPDDDWLIALLLTPSDSLIVEIVPSTDFYWNMAQLLGRRYVRSTYEALINNKGKPYYRFVTPTVKSSLINPAALANLIINSINFPETQYLLYMPWEQLNNQLIELKCACAVASLLERVLVLPYLGYRKPDPPSNETWNFSFEFDEFDWLPMETYFDEQFFSEYAPCRMITNDNFRSLFEAHGETTLGDLQFNPFGKATLEHQPHDYYHTLMKYPITKTVTTPRYYQLKKEEVINVFGTVTDHFLPLGCTFWIYGFGKAPPYPPPGYVDYMEDPMYTDIAFALFGSLRGRPLKPPSSGGLSIPSSVQTGKLAFRTEVGLGGFIQYMIHNPKMKWEGQYISLHVRRGDYWNKCKRIRNEEQRSQCFLSAERVRQAIDEMSKGLVRRKSGLKQSSVIIYLATNAEGDERKEFEEIEKSYRVIYFDDLVTGEMKNSLQQLDLVERALLDILLSAFAEDFYGNLYSSFSRSIIEMRQLAGSQYHVF